MPIPNATLAEIAPEKLTGYLLNDNHPIGGAKSRWFRQLGYDPSDPGVLERDLLEVVHTSDDYSVKTSPFGTKYVVSGKIKTPSGTNASVVTVWIVEPSQANPRLVTGYPGAKP